MVLNIPPDKLPPIRTRTLPIKRPWNIDPSCVLCLMPEVNTKWIDHSGKGNDGTIDGATKIHNGRFGEGLLFDGIDDYVNCGNDSSFCFSDGSTDESFSAEAWINMPDVTDTGVIVSKYNDVIAGGRGWLFIMAAGRIAVNTYDDDAASYIGKTAVTAYGAAYNNIWVHIVFTYDGSGISAGFKIYADGVRINDANAESGAYTAMDTTTVTTDVGRRRSAAGVTELVFNGFIDEARIYNRALAAWEIKALYEQGRP